jgi:hypothetical protein
MRYGSTAFITCAYSPTARCDHREKRQHRAEGVQLQVCDGGDGDAAEA